MILIDANLLLYAQFTNFSQHEAAKAWLDAQLNGAAQVGLPWASLLAFVRVATDRRVFASAMSIDRALTLVERWLGAPPTWIPEPTERHMDVLRSMLVGAGGGAKLVPDAHLAALAAEHGLTVCSADSNFARFPSIRWINPLSPRR